VLRQETTGMRHTTAAATIISKMKPEKIGRTLGIGLRIAGRVAGERIAASAQTAPAAPPASTASGPSGNQNTDRTVGSASITRGLSGFLRPFRRVGGILWLEVTGSFFFLFALVAGVGLLRSRPAHLHGPYDRNFLAALVVIVVFSYLGVTSFWRARKK